MAAGTARRAPHWLSCFACVLVVACGQAPDAERTTSPPRQDREPAATRTVTPSPPLVRAARAQVGVTVTYDPAYVRLPYPGGDVPQARGVCTDVVIRALRAQGIDLQRAIHEDRLAHGAAYAPAAGRRAIVDRNIDHRRVPNQMLWFERQGWKVPITGLPDDYAAGDIVAWRLHGSGLLHIGVVSDRRARDGVPLIVHNIGRGAQEEPLLFAHTIIGHYRPRLSSDGDRLP